MNEILSDKRTKFSVIINQQKMMKMN